MRTIEEFKNLPDDNDPTIPSHSSGFRDEQDVVIFIARVLYEKLGEKGTWSVMTREGIKFAFTGNTGTCFCLANIGIEYQLPDGSTLTHRPDILADIGGLRVGVEVKFRSSVTDQFKARSYDMIHIKRSNPGFYGVVVYVKGQPGIGPDHAKSICYAHDFFFTLPEASAKRIESWDPLIIEFSRLLKKSR